MDGDSMNAEDIQADLGEAVTHRLDELAHFTDGGRLTRLYLTPVHRRAAERVLQWMR